MPPLHLASLREVSLAQVFSLYILTTYARSIWKKEQPTALLTTQHWFSMERLGKRLINWRKRGYWNLAYWLDSSLLSLNMVKTKYLTFSIRNNTGPPPDLSLRLHNCCESERTICNCPEISCAEQIKYLGVIIDDKLRWKPHVDLTTSRVRKMIWVFKRLRGIADLKVLHMVYYALCHSLINLHFLHFCVGWMLQDFSDTSRTGTKIGS